MPLKEAIEVLSDWFGTRAFRVCDLSPEGQDEMIELADLQHISHSSNNGRRSGVGLWLNRASGQDFPLGSQSVRLVVVVCCGYGNIRSVHRPWNW